MARFDIEIVSDNVCPWCYVGKQKLERAITEYKRRHGDQDSFSTTFMPFYLNPDAPKQGIDKANYYAQKFGADRTKLIFERLAQVGRQEGINFKFGGKTGNTRDSHRLVQLGKTKSPEVQTRVVEELFAAYFENEEDITSHHVLRAAGLKAGLEGTEIDEWLTSDKGGKEVDAEVHEAKGNQISGVPNFMINGKYEIGGAQDPAVFLNLFEKIKASQVSTKDVSGSGETC